MKKVLSLALCLSMVLVVFTGCAQTSGNGGDSETTAAPTAADTTTAAPEVKDSARVVALKGPTGLGLVKLMEDSELGETANEYVISLASAPDEISGQLISGQVDIAAIPANLASVLYNKSEGQISLLALNTLGVLYILEKGDTVSSVADLQGKTLYATGQASTPEYILNHILAGNDLTPGTDLTVEYKTEHSELATLAAAGEVALCMLPEPHVTSVLAKNPDFRIALDLTEQWNVIEPEALLVQGCIVVRNEYLQNHGDAVEIFLSEYAASVEYANTDVPGASALAEKYGIVASAGVAEAAIPRCNIVCITGSEMKESMKTMLSVLFQANPASIGGKLPEDSFYYGA